VHIVWGWTENRPGTAPETSVVDTQSGIRNNYRLTSGWELVQDLPLEVFRLLLALTSHSSPVLPWNGKSANF
jgi:hypothetical protein